MATVVLLGFSTTGKSTILTDFASRCSRCNLETVDADKDRTCFLTILRIHPDVGMDMHLDVAENVAVTDLVVAEIDRSKRILALCVAPKSREEIFSIIGLTNQTKNFQSAIIPLIEQAYLTMTIPDKPRSKLQKYQTTLTGKSLIRATEE